MKPLFSVGDQVKFIKQVDIARITTISKRETGIITQITYDGTDTLVYIKMDQYHRGLDEWDNNVIMLDRPDERYHDIAPSLRVNCIPR